MSIFLMRENDIWLIHVSRSIIHIVNDYIIKIDDL